jgi:hypothetical protein
MTPPEDLDSLAADWIALWESELAGLGQDAELAEAWAASVALMAAVWRAQGASVAAQMAAAAKWRAPDEPPASAARPAPAEPAPHAGRQPGPGGADESAAQSAALGARLAELEQRLAALEGRPGGGGADRRKPRAPRRKP